MKGSSKKAYKKKFNDTVKSKAAYSTTCHGCGFRIIMAPSTSGNWISLGVNQKQPLKGEWYYDEEKLRMVKARSDMKKFVYMNHVCDNKLKLKAYSNGQIKVIKKTESSKLLTQLLLNKFVYFVGIDPGVDTGYVEYSKATKSFHVVKTCSFWGTVQELMELKSDGVTFAVIIEDPGLNKFMYWQDKRAKSFPEMTKTAQNVGMNKAYARLLIEFLEDYEIPYFPVKPVTKKWNQEYFKKTTGCTFKTSQHVRDAAKLVWGY